MLRTTARSFVTPGAVGRLCVRLQQRQSFSVAPDKASALAVNTSIGRSLWNFYSSKLEQSPLLTKATLAALIFFGSDSATQYLLRDHKNDAVFAWDVPRALSGATFGVVATTWLHYWWGFLEAVVGKRLPMATHKLSNTLTKVVLDQGIGAPLYIYSYYVLTNLSQSLAASNKEDLTVERVWKTLEETSTRAQDMLWPTMLQHWRLWPAVHSINFYYTPLHHRVLVQNTVLVGWSGYLSHLNNGGLLMTPDEEVNLVRRETNRRMQEQELKESARA